MGCPVIPPWIVHIGLVQSLVVSLDSSRAAGPSSVRSMRLAGILRREGAMGKGGTLAQQLPAAEDGANGAGRPEDNGVLLSNHALSEVVYGIGDLGAVRWINGPLGGPWREAGWMRAAAPGNRCHGGESE